MTPRIHLPALTALLFAGFAGAISAQEIPAKRPENTSLRNEVGLSINRALNFLKGQQLPDGSWSLPELPALTGLVTTAFLREPSGQNVKNQPEAVKKGLAYILASQQPDGGLYRKGYLNYNTSICMMALVASQDETYAPVLARARLFVIDGQYSVPTDKVDDPLNGGIGYGNKNRNPDLSNTVIALESLRATKDLPATGEVNTQKKLNWEAALGFVQRCQNVPENKDPWVSPESQDRGGFFYQPGSTRGEEVTLPDGKKVFRSYGSMTYAGLLSYIYCDLKKDDPRVTAAIDWLRANYTLDKNPGVSGEDAQDGLFYYYQMMAKALATYGIEELPLTDGRKVNWRKDLAEKLISLQKGDGSWANPSSRWMEADPILVTSYCVLALETIYGGL